MADPYFSSRSARISEFTPPRRRRWLRALASTLAALVLLVAVLAAAGVVWLRSAAKTALPQLDGDIHVGGLSAPVTVRRDDHGVPYIEAANQDDLFVAQGYVTAQDRLWQMDIYRRNANGELAEILGPSLVKHDSMQRVLGFRKAAQRVYANLGADDRRYLDDYARGVNLFIEQHQDSLPPEFRLLMYKPKPWTGADSISIGTMMIDMLDTHWDVKLFRERIAAKLNNPQLESELYPVGSWRDRPPTGEVIDLTQPHPVPPTSDDEDEENTVTRAAHRPAEQAAAVHSRGRTAVRCEQAKGNRKSFDSAAQKARCSAPEDTSAGHAETALAGLGTRRTSYADAGDSFDEASLRAELGLADCDGCGAGSNNWVVSGKHTASGKPLLANDMHLPHSVPNIWYMAELRAPGFHAAGVSLPGMPMIIAGHNDHVAWGFTALYADVQDLYVEKLDGKGNYQAADGTWKPLAVDPETIRVRGSRDVTIDVQSTAHGPVVTAMIPGESRPIALKWTLYDSSLNGLPLYAMNTAQNWAEFSAAIGQWCWPTQNLVYSDDQGHIAYHAVGKVPVRPSGLAGVPIHDSLHEWNGYIPFDSMPNAFDPPSGFLATANARVTTDKSAYPLSLEWIDPYRIERIYKSLQGRDGLTPKDMIAVQTDIYSEVDQELAHRFAYAIDHAAGTDERLRKAADLMRSWDGKLSTDSAAASIVVQARRALWPIILEPKLGKLWHDYRWSEKDFAEEEIIMNGGEGWLPPGFKDWDAVLTEAVRRGMTGEDKAPADVSKWAYGSWHQVDIQHPLASMLPWIARIEETGPLPQSGDETTVKQVGRSFGPSQRFTMDWSNIDGSTENIVLGESSDPYSSYFRDQWNDWYHGTTFALPFSEAAVAASTRHTVRLTP